MGLLKDLAQTIIHEGKNEITSELRSDTRKVVRSTVQNVKDGIKNVASPDSNQNQATEQNSNVTNKGSENLNDHWSDKTERLVKEEEINDLQERANELYSEDGTPKNIEDPKDYLNKMGALSAEFTSVAGREVAARHQYAGDIHSTVAEKAKAGGDIEKATESSMRAKQAYQNADNALKVSAAHKALQEEFDKKINK